MESLLVLVATMSYYFSLIRVFCKVLSGRELDELFACNVQCIDVRHWHLSPIPFLSVTTLDLVSPTKIRECLNQNSPSGSCISTSLASHAEPVHISITYSMEPACQLIQITRLERGQYIHISILMKSISCMQLIVLRDHRTCKLLLLAIDAHIVNFRRKHAQYRVVVYQPQKIYFYVFFAHLRPLATQKKLRRT